MTYDAAVLPKPRGKLIANASLAPYTWFRVGGPADALFLPVDEDDLAGFLKALDPEIPVTVLGVGSNVIVRDGGIRGVTIRLMGRHWGEILQAGDTLIPRAGALDLAIAKEAAGLGLAGLSFLSGIPGTIGGATRTNAGCYGRELSDVITAARAVTRTGEIVDLTPEDFGFAYRHSELPLDLIVTNVTLRASGKAEPAALRAEIAAHQARRAATQPVRDKTSGSTFANPDPPGTADGRSAWKLIDAAGCRGLRVGGAQVSDQHCNFLINTGNATASDIEALGELVRARVLDTSGVDLRWEIRRIGQLPAHAPD